MERSWGRNEIPEFRNDGPVPYACKTRTRVLEQGFGCGGHGPKVDETAQCEVNGEVINIRHVLVRPAEVEPAEYQKAAAPLRYGPRTHHTYRRAMIFAIEAYIDNIHKK